MPIFFYYISQVVAQKPILRNILPWYSKKVIHLLFSVFQTNLIFLQTTRMDQKCTNDTNFQYNLAWLSENTKDLKSNKGNLTSLHKQFIPPFQQKNSYAPPPQVIQFLEDNNNNRNTSPLIRGGGGVSTMLSLSYFFQGSYPLQQMRVCSDLSLFSKSLIV